MYETLIWTRSKDDCEVYPSLSNVGSLAIRGGARKLISQRKISESTILELIRKNIIGSIKWDLPRASRMKLGVNGELPTTHEASLWKCMHSLKELAFMSVILDPPYFKPLKVYNKLPLKTIACRYWFCKLFRELDILQLGMKTLGVFCLPGGCGRGEERLGFETHRLRACTKKVQQKYLLRKRIAENSRTTRRKNSKQQTHNVCSLWSQTWWHYKGGVCWFILWCEVIIGCWASNHRIRLK